MSASRNNCQSVNLVNLRGLSNVIMAPWQVPKNVYAFTTTRQSSFKNTMIEEIQCAHHVSNNTADVLCHRQQLQIALKLSRPVQWLRQVHGHNIIRAMLAEQNAVADACMSDQTGQACVVMTADCLPVFFYDQCTCKVAVAHAGWRGLVSGVLENTLQALGGEPENILITFGPAVSRQCFEVGDEVKQKFIEVVDNMALISKIENAFVPSSTHADKWLADLYSLAFLRLQFAGIPMNNISKVNYCTYLQKEYFYSYRREGDSGRLISMIFIDQ